MRKKKKWIYVAVAIVLFAISSTLYVKSRPSAPAPNPNAASGSMLKFKAAKEDLVNTVEVKGKSSYVHETPVIAPFTAEVAEWRVTEGAQVKTGDILFKLDDKALRREIDLQRANVMKMELEAKMKRAQDAASAKGGSPIGSTEAEALQRYAQTATRGMQEELDSLNLSKARTELAMKQEQLDKAAFAAPESGIFLFAGTKEPRAVREGETIGKIIDVSKLQMVVAVGEYDVFRIQPGMPVDIKIDALKDVKLKGKVEHVSKFPKSGDANSGSAQFEVTVSLEPHEKLIAGLSLTGTIETDRKQGALAVPTLAVQRDKDGYYVMVETEQGVQRRNIKIGLETPDNTEVLEGLNEGDTVVLQ